MAEVTFADKLFAHLKTNLGLISLDLQENKYVISSLNDVLAKVEDNSLVLLVDEYDAPLTATMGDRKCYLISCETVPLALYTDVQAKGKSFCCRRFLKPFGLDVGSAKVLC